MSEREVRPIFYVEHVAERATAAMLWLIAACSVYIGLEVVPMVLDLVGVSVPIVDRLPLWVRETCWIVPAVIGLLALEHALHLPTRFGYWRWALLGAAFWVAGVLGMKTELISIWEDDAIGTGVRAQYPVWPWALRLALLALAAFWLVNLVATARRVLDGAWPGQGSTVLGGWALGLGLIGHAVVLGWAAACHLGAWEYNPTTASYKAIITIQFASWYIWPVVILVLLIVNRRALVGMDRGRCLACGFELHGHFDGGCPECGWRRAEREHSQNDC